MPSEPPEEGPVWTARWAGGFASDVRGPVHGPIRVDEPHSAGGEDTGPMPTELLTAALASCFCAAVAWAARKKRVEIEDLEVRVAPRREPGEPRYASYSITVRASAPKNRLTPVVELASRYCWVTNTLLAMPAITYHLEAGSG